MDSYDATDNVAIELDILQADEGNFNVSFSGHKSGGTLDNTSDNEIEDLSVDTTLPSMSSPAEHDPVMDKALVRAARVSDLEGIKEALQNGADIDARAPPIYISALHFSSWIGNNQIVEYLIEKKASLNLADRYGRTPLHLAAAMGYKDCVLFLLEAGAEPNAATHDMQPRNLINMGVANAIAASARPLSRHGGDFDQFLDGFQMPGSDCGRRTPLHEAVKANSPECVKLILEKGGNSNAVDSVGMVPLMFAGEGVIPEDVEAVSRYEQVVSDLLEHKAEAKACYPKKGTSALINAVILGSSAAVKLLLKRGAEAGWCSDAGGLNTALHEAAASNKLGILDIILENQINPKRRKELTNLPDNEGRTPLHKAAYSGSKCCVALLLDNGADLGIRTKDGVTAMELMLRQFSRPKLFMSNLLDSRISCNSSSAEERGFRLDLDFGILTPDGKNKQTGVLNSLITAKWVAKEIPRSILGHPLLEAFVRLKWHRLRLFFLVVVVTYAVFVISLSTYVTLEFLYPPGTEKRSSKINRLIMAARYIHLCFAGIALAIVFGQCISHFRYYSRQFETWINGLSALLSIIWVIALEHSSNNIHGMGNQNWVKHFISIAVPLSWAGLMLVLGRFPLWGSHALLFAAVLKNVLWTFIVLGCIVLGFSFSFFVQFHESHPANFGNPWRAFIKTMVMMTGEYEYTAIFSEENENKVLHGTSRVTFLIFVIVASIVLVNLIVGLAVSDTQALKSEGEARCLYKRAEFVDLLEGMVAPVARQQALPTKVTLSPNGKTNDKGYELARLLPSKLLDELMDIAVMRRENGSDKADLLDYRGSWMYNVLPRGDEKGNVEEQVFNRLQTFLRDISMVLAPDGIDIQRRAMENNQGIGRIGSQLLRAQSAMRNHHLRRNRNPVKFSRCRKPPMLRL